MKRSIVLACIALLVFVSLAAAALNHRLFLPLVTNQSVSAGSRTPRVVTNTPTPPRVTATSQATQPSASTPTPTVVRQGTPVPSATPQASATPRSASPTAPGSTSTAIAATATRPPATATVAPPSGSSVAFPLGPGMVDGTGAQVVRTEADQLLIFAFRMTQNTLHVYRASGLPTTSADFTSQNIAVPAGAGSVTTLIAAYNGNGLVYVPVLTTSGRVYAYVFDVNANAFRAPVEVASDGAPLRSDTLYAGTTGLSGALDATGVLHIAYWTNGNRIQHCALSYNTATQSWSACSPTVVDADGSSNHPALAVSPADNSLTVAWISEAGANYRILTRRRDANGSWGAIEQASNVEVYHGRGSNGNEVNVDNGPQMVIDAQGVRHLIYVQHFDPTGDYGRMHYSVNTGSGWQSTALPNYSHVPNLAFGRNSQLLIIGHGWDKSLNADPACLTGRNFCYMARNGDGTWGPFRVIATPQIATQSLDSNPSVKWSAVHWYRPETVEFAFFSVDSTTNSYYNPTLWYGRLP